MTDTTNWKQMKEEYASGGTSYRQLAARYGVSYSAVAKRARAENWVGLKQEHTFQNGAPSAEETRMPARIEAIADKLLERVSELVDIMVMDTHGVKQLASALKDLRDIKAYDSEIALRRAKLRKLEQEMEAETGATRIEVVFEAGKEQWNE